MQHRLLWKTKYLVVCRFQWRWLSAWKTKRNLLNSLRIWIQANSWPRAEAGEKEAGVELKHPVHLLPGLWHSAGAYRKYAACSHFTVIKGKFKPNRMSCTLTRLLKRQKRSVWLQIVYLTNPGSGVSSDWTGRAEKVTRGRHGRCLRSHGCWNLPIPFLA